MPRATKFTLETLFSLCETYYKVQGYVNWSDVARDLGVSRQAIVDRLDKSLENGSLTEADYTRWANKPVRREASAEREAARRDAQRRTVSIVLTPENHAWVRIKCTTERKKTGDIINRLLDEARERT